MTYIPQYLDLYEEADEVYSSDQIEISSASEDSVLFVRYTPFAPLLLVALIWACVVVFAFYIWVHHTNLPYPSGYSFGEIVVFVVPIFFPLVVPRKITTIIDLQNDRFYVKQHGILDSEFLSSVNSFSLKRVHHVIMKRHVSRYTDGFEIKISVGSQEVSLSGINLGFADCQKSARLIRKYMKLKKDVVAVD